MMTTTMPSTHVRSMADTLQPVQTDLRAVEARMRALGVRHHEVLAFAMDHLLAAGGKRVRPALAMLVARMFAAPQARAESLAAAIEMLHTATLVHDDLVDGALLRRGMPTLNAHWTPAATVLAGDFLFGRAAELAAEAESVAVMKVFAQTLMVIVNGELTQMFNSPGVASREGYFDRIYGKTASLFAVAAEAPALLAEAEPGLVAAMRVYGREAGMAFQIVDDILDFTSDETRLGKPAGSDLRQGLITLPALCYLEQHPNDPNFSALLNGHAGDPELVAQAVAAVRQSGAIEAALAEAKAYVARAQTALSHAPAGVYRQSLSDLADLFVYRDL